MALVNPVECYLSFHEKLICLDSNNTCKQNLLRVFHRVNPVEYLISSKQLYPLKEIQMIDYSKLVAKGTT
jgi:hypothetical protein